MALLFDSGIFSVEGLSGEILAGAKLYWYASGTSTPQATYSDEALVTPNANPVVASADGRFPAIWLQPLEYKLVLKSFDDTTLVTRDPIHGVLTGEALLVNADALSNDADDLDAITAKLRYKRSQSGSASRTVQSMLNDRPVELAEFGTVTLGSLSQPADATAIANNNAALATAIATGRPVRLPPGIITFDDPDETIQNDVTGASVQSTVVNLLSGTFLRIDQVKALKVGDFSVGTVSGSITDMIRIGGAWDCEIGPIYFNGNGSIGDTRAIKIGDIGSGGFGTQGNRFIGLTFDNSADFIVDATQEYFNANQMFGGIFMPDSALVLNGTLDVHGNDIIGTRFQSARSVSNQKSQVNRLIGCYVEDCDNFNGLWAIDGGTVTGSDERIRGHRLSTQKIVDHGDASFMPTGIQFRNITAFDERFLAGNIADTDNVSASGRVLEQVGGAGAFDSYTLITSGQIDNLIRAFGFVTVVFDAKRLSGSAGNIEYLSSQYLGQITDEWQTYVFNISSVGAFLKIYSSNASAGTIRICNFGVFPGKQGAIPIPMPHPRLFADASIEVPGSANLKIIPGSGSPEGVVTADVGSLYLNMSGGGLTTLYVKTSGTGNTGWTAK